MTELHIHTERCGCRNKLAELNKALRSLPREVFDPIASETRWIWDFHYQPPPAVYKSMCDPVECLEFEFDSRWTYKFRGDDFVVTKRMFRDGRWEHQDRVVPVEQGLREIVDRIKNSFLAMERELKYHAEKRDGRSARLILFWAAEARIVAEEFENISMVPCPGSSKRAA